jgi:enolase
MSIGAKVFSEGICQIADVFHSLNCLQNKAEHNTLVGDEGGFTQNLNNEDGSM